MAFLNRKSDNRGQDRAAPGGLADPRPTGRQPAARPPEGKAAAIEDIESVIGNDFSIEGQTITIRCKGSLRVNGHIQANLHSRRLVVGEAAHISGAIVAEDVAVHGQVEGSISGANVRLEPTAVVDGDIAAHNLSIDTGAKFEGRSHWVDDPSAIAPQVEPPLQAGRLTDAGQPSAARDMARETAARDIASRDARDMAPRDAGLREAGAMGTSYHDSGARDVGTATLQRANSGEGLVGILTPPPGRIPH